MTTPVTVRGLILIPVVLGLISMAAAGSPAQAVPKTVTITGRVLGASGKHTVHVALWDAAGFLKKPAQELQFKPQASPDFQFRVTPGSWTISAYEDENENGVLDVGMFGPKEPSGFWRAFRQWRKPRFTDVSSTIEKDIANADIRVHK
jgi:uncharacterized protein (DUF2141 family)